MAKQLVFLVLGLSILWFIAGEIQGRGRVDRLIQGVFKNNE